MDSSAASSESTRAERRRDVLEWVTAVASACEKSVSSVSVETQTMAEGPSNADVRLEAVLQVCAWRDGVLKDAVMDWPAAVARAVTKTA